MLALINVVKRHWAQLVKTICGRAHHLGT